MSAKDSNNFTPDVATRSDFVFIGLCKYYLYIFIWEKSGQGILISYGHDNHANLRASTKKIRKQQASV